MTETVFSSPLPTAERQRFDSKQYRRHLETVCNHATVALFIMDEHQQCTYMNPAAERLTGYTLAEVQGRALHDVIHHTRPDGTPYFRWECPIDRAFPQRAQEQGEEIFVHKDGSFYPVAYTASPIREGEAIVGTVIEVQDIRARKEADESLRRQNERLKLLSEAAAELLRTDDPDLMVRRLFEKVSVHLGLDGYFNFMLNEAGDALALDSCAGIPAEAVEGIRHLDFGQAVCGTVALQRAPIIASDVQSSNDPKVQLIKGFGIRAYACNPLMAGDRLLGTLSFATRNRDRYSEEDLEFLRTVSHYVALAKERLRLTREALERAERLAESEERFRTLADTMPQLVWTAEPDGTVDYYNARVQQFQGFEFYGATGRWSWKTCLHPDDQERTAKAWTDAVASGREYQIEHRVGMQETEGDGYRWFLSRGVPVRDEAGVVIKWYGTATDIQATKAAEEALRENERRLRFVLDSMPQKIFTAKPNGDVDYFNPIWTEFTGLSFEQIRDWGWTQFIHPEDVSENVRVWQRSIDTGEPFQFEHRFRRADGEYRWHISRAVPMRDEAGRVAMWIGSNTDIHELKRAEQEAVRRSEQVRRLADLATRMNAARDVAWMVDVVTEEARHLIGAHQSVTSFTIDQSRGQAINAVSLSQKYAAWRNYDTKPDGSGIYAPICRSNQPMRMTQAELEGHPAWSGFGTEAGKHPPMRGWLAAPLVGQDGRNIGLIRLSDKYEGDFGEEDESILVQLAQMASIALENARLVDGLREADRRKDEFLAMLAHELRNPLAPILTSVEILRMPGAPEPVLAKQREVIARQVKQMKRLLDDLLEVSRITRGKVQLCKERVELSAVLAQAIETSRPLVEQKGHTLQVTVSAEPLELEADPARLSQVFTNLLNNAAKYTEPHGQIWLTTDQEDDGVRVTVKDSGTGMTPEVAASAFDLFAQGEQTIDRSQGGLGIGLTLVRQLVEMHGGSVSGHSAGPGQGSEFIVRLPALARARAL